MTPQELMDLNGAGNAEKHLRRMKKWKLPKMEMLEDAFENLLYTVETAQDQAYNIERILNEEEKE